jgi:hypothetical protein
MQVLSSPDAPRNEKRVALRFVAHLVGTFTNRSMPDSPKIAVVYSSPSRKIIHTTVPAAFPSGIRKLRLVA